MNYFIALCLHRFHLKSSLQIVNKKLKVFFTNMYMITILFVILKILSLGETANLWKVQQTTA